jgi:hypothetical protein
MTNAGLIPTLDAGSNVIPGLATTSGPWEYAEIGNSRVVDGQVPLAGAIAVGEGTNEY